MSKKRGGQITKHQSTVATRSGQTYENHSVPQRNESDASDKVKLLAEQLGYQGPAAESYQVCCPAHDDGNPSMSLTTGNDAEIVFHCFAGCSQKDVLNALEDLDLWPVTDGMVTIRETQPLSSSQKGRPADEWDPQDTAGPLVEVPWFKKLGLMTGFYRYMREDGKLSYAICRYEKNGKKQVLPYTWCRNTVTGEEAWKNKKTRNPIPYRLFEIWQGRKQVPFVVVEGEKTADAAAELLKGQFEVTTWSGGTNAVLEADWKRLFTPAEGRPIVLLPDNDEPGLKAMDKLGEHLRSLGDTNVT
ncbi:MAG: hypothetical protein IH905_10235, partial [Proteobacteria bacterium]|nr:hypothetical protein [Pseudomonadota bacterium]